MSRRNRKKPRYLLEEEGVRRHPLRVDRSALSEKSRRSCSLPLVYVDHHFVCIGCGADCVFTAEQQKHQFEVKKDYVWKGRIRCEACQSEWHKLRKQIREFPAELRAGTLTIARASHMLLQLRRFAALSRGHADRALYHRIIKARRELESRPT
jgi:hypothetical protein